MTNFIRELEENCTFHTDDEKLEGQKIRRYMVYCILLLIVYLLNLK